MKKNNLLLNLLIVFMLCSCNNEISGKWQSVVATSIKGISAISSEGERYYANSNPFNTSMSLNYFLNDKDSEEYNNELIENVTNIYQSEVNRLHKMFDRHMYYEDENNDIINNVRVINNSYGTDKEIICDELLYNLLKTGVEAYELTNGMFNIFTGSISDFWSSTIDDAFSNDISQIDPYFNEEKKELLENLVERIPNNIDDVKRQLTFNDENKSVIFNKINIEENKQDTYRPYISVGGLAKGYATDIIKSTMLANNYKSGVLDSGHSTITSLSTPIHSSKVKGQKISISNPLYSIYQNEVAFSIQIADDFSFSTSANNTLGKHYWFVDTNTSNDVYYRHHIINPKTGYPENYHRSVSILSYDFSNMMLDILSTTFMNLSIEDGLNLRKEILAKYPNYSLELFYIDQSGYKDSAKIKVIATSSINDTLEVGESVELVYEE